MGKGTISRVAARQPARRARAGYRPALDMAVRRAAGKAARSGVPLEDQAIFAPTALRADPVELLSRQDAARTDELLPVRYGRMVSSPFAFFRGLPW